MTIIPQKVGNGNAATSGKGQPRKRPGADFTETGCLPEKVPLSSRLSGSWIPLQTRGLGHERLVCLREPRPDKNGVPVPQGRPGDRILGKLAAFRGFDEVLDG
jgi:hypothetical protein